MRLATPATCFALITAVLTLSSTAGAARTVDSCRTTDMKIVGSTQSNSTTSTAYVPVPEMVLTVPAVKPGCIVVELEAYGFAGAGNVMTIDAELDSNPVNTYLGGVPLQFVASQTGAGVDRMVRFIWVDVPAGSHSVRLFYKSLTGGPVAIRRPNMIVHYRK